MNIGKCKNKPKYICDKCGQSIPYVYKKGFAVNKYYKQNKYDYAIKKEFDLCDKCEKKFREWLEEKPLITIQDMIAKFPKWEGDGKRCVKQIK